MSTFLRLLTFLRPYKLTLLLGFLCLLASVALELAPPLVWKVVVDDVIVRRELAKLWPAVVALTLMQGGSALLSAVRTRLLEAVGQRFVFDLRNALYHKLSHQSLAYFNEARTGDLMSRASSDVDAVQEVVIRGTDSVLANFLRLAGVSVIFCALNLKLGLATLLPILLVGVFLKLFNKRVKGVYKGAGEVGAGQRQIAGQSFRHPGHQSLCPRRRRRSGLWAGQPAVFDREFGRDQAAGDVFPVCPLDRVVSATPSPSATGRG